MFSFVRSVLAVAIAAAAFALPGVARAHGDEGAQVVQDQALLGAVVALGGGAEKFSARTLRLALGGAVPDEDQALRKTLGAANVDRFDEVFTYVVNDGLGVLKRSGKTPPTRPAGDPKGTALALYRAGLHDGAFDIERVFDVLFTPQAHVHAMIAVGRKYGAAGESAYHGVFARLIQDTGKP